VKLRAFVLDDEKLAVTRLQSALESCEDVVVVGASTSPQAGLHQIAELKPDVVFLDISMPKLNGFDVVRQFGAVLAPAVIFVTAHQDHAVQAFEVNAVDYLLKPFREERLQLALSRARAALQTRDLVDQFEASFAECFWVSKHREMVRVSVSDLIWVEAEGDYVRFHGAGPGAGGLARATLSEIERSLDPAIFVRVHRSAISRRSSIIAVRRNSSGSMTATLITGEKIAVGRSYLRGLRHLASYGI
jgi:two-component system response regulator AlgR